VNRTKKPAGPSIPDAADPPRHDRSRLSRTWYAAIRFASISMFAATGGVRSGGRHNVPAGGPALLVSNHLSYLDVFVLSLPLRRPLNYVARSTLFLPGLGSLIRSVGGFAIQREGMGVSGLKETLRRLRNGGIVLLFPEGTRSLDGRIGELKPGIAALASRAGVPVVPAAVAGTFEAWPRRHLFPLPHPIRIEYGPAIFPADLAGMAPEAVTGLIRDRIADCQREALRGLTRDLRAGRDDVPSCPER